MNKFMLKASLPGLLAIALAAVPLHAQEAHTNAAPKFKHPARIIPFHGKLKAVDKTEMTITVGKETFRITSETRISKLGKPAVLDDGQVGDNVAGAYRKDDEGHLNALSLRFGPRLPAEVPNSKTNAPNTP